MNRKSFLIKGGAVLAAAALAPSELGANIMKEKSSDDREVPAFQRDLTLFLSGDVMTGRGIDQILPHSVPPVLRESHVKSAEVYVRLAEQAGGSIPDHVSPEYIWGDALKELDRVKPDARVINLETAVTRSDDWWPGKAVHYRMHPENVDVLNAAGIDVCILGNNHVMDFGYAGLEETLDVIEQAGLATAGAGKDRDAAAAPAVVETSSGRLLVFSYGCPSAGVPDEWQASHDRPGVNFLNDLRTGSADRVVEDVERHRREGDRVVVSLHWGSNWGYTVPSYQREIAHRLVDAGMADIVYGHSSHHPMGVEVHRGRLILYGCGDLINDYEGISGHESYRSELTLMYFPRLDGSGELVSLEMAPMRTYRFSLVEPAHDEAEWLAKTMDRESREFGAGVELTRESRLRLSWGF